MTIIHVSCDENEQCIGKTEDIKRGIERGKTKRHL